MITLKIFSFLNSYSNSYVATFHMDKHPFIGVATALFPDGGQVISLYPYLAEI